MSKGFLLYAFDNERTAYGKLADICALLIHRYMGCPVSVVVDASTVVNRALFDQVITVEANSVNDFRGVNWKNKDRHNYFVLSPYEQTLVIDSDYLLFNNHLSKLWDNADDIILSKDARQLNGELPYPNECRLDSFGLDMTWATCFYFRKSLVSEKFFELVEYVRVNYEYYASLYALQGPAYRNDYVFSIARHIWADSREDMIKNNPYTLLTAYPQAELQAVKVDGLVLHDPSAASKLFRLKNRSVHVLNKQSILTHYDHFRSLYQ